MEFAMDAKCGFNRCKCVFGVGLLFSAGFVCSVNHPGWLLIRGCLACVSLGLTSWSVLAGQEGDDEVQELHGQFPEAGCLPTSRH